jgi:hypothetical protein
MGLFFSLGIGIIRNMCGIESPRVRNARHVLYFPHYQIFYQQKASYSQLRLCALTHKHPKFY